MVVACNSKNQISMHVNANYFVAETQCDNSPSPFEDTKWLVVSVINGSINLKLQYFIQFDCCVKQHWRISGTKIKARRIAFSRHHYRHNHPYSHRCLYQHSYLDSYLHSYPHPKIPIRIHIRVDINICTFELLERKVWSVCGESTGDLFFSLFLHDTKSEMKFGRGFR